MIRNSNALNIDKSSLETRNVFTDNITEETTLDSLLAYWAVHRPNAFAFADTPNKKQYGLGEPLQLNFLDADKIVSKIAEQFKQHGLNPGDVLAIQLPNTAELPLIVLGAIRAGLIPCLFPISWRTYELDKAFRMIPARALVTVGEFTDYPFSQMMCELAFDHIHIRFIYGIGPNQTEGVTSLNNLFSNLDNAPDYTNNEKERFTPHILQPAIITWAARQSIAFRPIYRTHAELIAAGMMHGSEIGLSESDRLLNPYPLTSLIGLSNILLPALLSGSYIIQHHPFDYNSYISQIRSELATYALAPASVLKAFVENDVFTKEGKTLNSFGCVWVTPHDREAHSLNNLLDIPVYDLQNLNETVVYIRRRTNQRDQGEIKLGEHQSSHFPLDDSKVLETRFRGRMNSGERDDKKYHGTLYVRGASVPKGSGLPAQTKKQPSKSDEWVNTGIHCSIPKNTEMMDRVQPDFEQDIIYHGGSIMFADELDSLYSSYDNFEDAIVIKGSDAIMGEALIVAAVAKKETQPTMEGLASFLRDSGVATYKIPKKLILVNSIPRNELGAPIRDGVNN